MSERTHVCRKPFFLFFFLTLPFGTKCPTSTLSIVIKPNATVPQQLLGITIYSDNAAKSNSHNWHDNKNKPFMTSSIKMWWYKSLNWCLVKMYEWAMLQWFQCSNTTVSNVPMQCSRFNMFAFIRFPQMFSIGSLSLECPHVECPF